MHYSSLILMFYASMSLFLYKFQIWFDVNNHFASFIGNDCFVSFNYNAFYIVAKQLFCGISQEYNSAVFSRFQVLIVMNLFFGELFPFFRQIFFLQRIYFSFNHVFSHGWICFSFSCLHDGADEPFEDADFAFFGATGCSWTAKPFVSVRGRVATVAVRVMAFSSRIA